MIRLPRVLSANEYAVVSLLLDRGVVSKPDLADAAGISRPAIGDLISRLESLGVVHEQGESQAVRRGPNARQYAVTPGVGTVMGIEIQPGFGRACVADINGSLLGQGDVCVEQNLPPAELALTAARAACHNAGITLVDVDVVVVGTPGVVGPDGDLDFVSGHPGWTSGVKAALAKELAGEVILENDLNLAAIAEYRMGGGSGLESLALIRCEGLGAALIFNGSLVRGAHGYAGELGLAPLAGDSANVNTASRRILSGYGSFVRILESFGVSDATPEQMLAQPGLHPEVNEQFLQEIAQRCAWASLTVCAVIDPQRILLTGSLANAGGERLMAAVSGQIISSSPLRTAVYQARFEDYGVVAGGIISGVDRLRSTIYGDAAESPARVWIPASWYSPDPHPAQLSVSI